MWQNQARSNTSPLVEQRLGTLISNLAEVQAEMARIQNRLMPFDRTFFAPQNLDAFVQSYWCHWYPHCPIVDPLAFDVNSIPLPLLLGIFLTGAVFSPCPHTTSTARDHFDLAEEFIFRNPDFTTVIDGASIGSPAGQYSPVGFHALQAAFSIAVLQTFEGSSSARRRIRTYRYTDIITVTRTLSLPSKHNDASYTQCSLSATSDYALARQGEYQVR
ncbi:unnamed protein product [Penicillium bialowiezense]